MWKATRQDKSTTKIERRERSITRDQVFILWDIIIKMLSRTAKESTSFEHIYSSQTTIHWLLHNCLTALTCRGTRRAQFSSLAGSVHRNKLRNENSIRAQVNGKFRKNSTFQWIKEVVQRSCGCFSRIWESTTHRGSLVHTSGVFTIDRFYCSEKYDDRCLSESAFILSIEATHNAITWLSSTRPEHESPTKKIRSNKNRWRFSARLAMEGNLFD